MLLIIGLKFTNQNAKLLVIWHSNILPIEDNPNFHITKTQKVFFRSQNLNHRSFRLPKAKPILVVGSVNPYFLMLSYIQWILWNLNLLFPIIVSTFTVAIIKEQGPLTQDYETPSQNAHFHNFLATHSVFELSQEFRSLLESSQFAVSSTARFVGSDLINNSHFESQIASKIINSVPTNLVRKALCHGPFILVKLFYILPLALYFSQSSVTYTIFTMCLGRQF